MKWKSIQINKQNVEYNTGKSVLIKMPHKSKYDGYSFWHPAKLVRDGYNSYAISLGYTDGFTFHLKKYGKGKWNKSEIISEIDITAEDFEEAFGVMDENIEAPKTYLKINEPEKIEKNVEVNEELKNK